MDKGIISGFPDGTIKPDSEITRAEAVVLIVRALNLQADKDTKCDFADENNIPDWAKQYVNVAVKNGIIKGFDDKTFRAADKVSRKEMAVMLVQAFGLKSIKGSSASFADNSLIPKWAQEQVSIASEIGIIKGYKDNTFKPNKNISRAETFTMLFKCLELE